MNNVIRMVAIKIAALALIAAVVCPASASAEGFLEGTFIVECPKNSSHRDKVENLTRNHDCETCGAKTVDGGTAVVVCPDGHGGKENKVEGITRQHQCQYKYPDGHLCGKQSRR